MDINLFNKVNTSMRLKLLFSKIKARKNEEEEEEEEEVVMKEVWGEEEEESEK